MFKEMKFTLLNVRLYPFLEMMTTALYVMVIAAIDSSPILQTLILMCLQGMICLYTSTKKPYIKNIDNMRVIVDKIINLMISIVFFVFAANENKQFIGNYTRVRFLERGFLMILLLTKLFMIFIMFMIKVVNEIKDRNLKKKLKREAKIQAEKLAKQKAKLESGEKDGETGEDEGASKKVKVKRKLNAR